MSRALQTGGVPSQAITVVSHRRSLFVSPDVAHGWWLEFRQKQ